jgi:polygalacturonase
MTPRQKTRNLNGLRGKYGVNYICAVVALTLAFLQCSQNQDRVTSIAYEKIDTIIAPFEMPQLQRPAIPAKYFDIRDFGAMVGGLVKNTRAIQNAIDSVANIGGGIIVIPEGKWLTGAIHLDNNINLHLAQNAELLFSQDVNDYLPVVFSRHEDIECYKYSSFVYALGKTNIAITGKGTLNGQGKPWWSWKEQKGDIEKLLNEMSAKDVPVEERIFDGKNGRELRPAFFQPMKCTNVLVESVTFLYGAFWTITPTYCENVIVRNVHIVTEGPYGHTPNGDGVNPSSCKNVLIENCEFDTGDDCIAIKAGRDKDGLRIGIPSQNIVIRNCRGFRGHGGIVIGSETSGGVRNVFAINCKFSGTDRIVRIKTTRGRGGIIENMWFQDLTGEEILMEAIHLNMLYTGTRLPAQSVSAQTPSIRNIHFENITCSSGKSYAIELLGLPEMYIENITFKGINASTAKGINVSDSREIYIGQSAFHSTVTPMLSFTDDENVTVDSVRFTGETSQILKVDGKKSKNIRIRKSGIQDPKKTVLINPSVLPNAVLIEE